MNQISKALADINKNEQQPMMKIKAITNLFFSSTVDFDVGD